MEKFIEIQYADKSKVPTAIAAKMVAEIRPYVPSQNDKNPGCKTVVVFKKQYAKPDIFSSNSIDELYSLFNVQTIKTKTK